MAEFKDRLFKDVGGTIPAKVGDAVGLILDIEPLSCNSLCLYTIVFNYGNKWQQYLIEDEKGRLCFVIGDSIYKKYSLKLFSSYEQAKQVMDELSNTSFTNEGILQVCSLELNAVGEPSKGIPDFMEHLKRMWSEPEDIKRY